MSLCKAAKEDLYKALFTRNRNIYCVIMQEGNVGGIREKLVKHEVYSRGFRRVVLFSFAHYMIVKLSLYFSCFAEDMSSADFI